MGIIARQSIKGTIVTYLGVAMGFFTTFFVLTRFLTSEEIGLARVLIDAATLLTGLAQMGTSSSIIRFFPYFNDTKKHTHHGFFFWTLLIPTIGFILFAGVYLGCKQPISLWFNEKSPLFVDFFYFVLPLSFAMLYQSVFETNSNVLMRIVVPKAVRELLVRAGMLICYLLYAFHILSIDGFVTAICINYSLAALINIIYVFALCPISLKPDWEFLHTHRQTVKEYCLYTAFLILSAVVSTTAPLISTFFVTAKMGLDYTGIFAIAGYIAVVVAIPYRSLAAIAMPQLSSAIQQHDKQQTEMLMQKVTTNALLVSSLILLTIWVNIDLLFYILPNGNTYAVAKNTVFILCICQLLLATLSYSFTALNFSKYYATTLLFSATLTASTIYFNNILTPTYGMTGAAMSNLLAYGIYFLLVVLTVLLCMRRNPFCLNQLRTFILLLVALAANYLLTRYLTCQNPFLNSAVRNILIVLPFCYIVYWQNISPDINALFHSFFLRRK